MGLGDEAGAKEGWDMVEGEEGDPSTIGDEYGFW